MYAPESLVLTAALGEHRQSRTMHDRHPGFPSDAARYTGLLAGI